MGIVINKKISDGDARKITNYLLMSSPAFYSGGNFNLGFKQNRQGGVEVLITKSEKKAAGKTEKPLIFCYEDINSLFTSAKEISRRYSHKISASDLYLYGGKYYLVIFPTFEMDLDFFLFLGEFSHFYGFGKEKAAKMKEFGHLLEKGRAIEKLCL
jgi:negative regulator of genetic competence, sporulation and motility